MRLSGAQDLTPSPLWKASTAFYFTRNANDRIAIASAALDKAVSMLQPNGQFNDSTLDIPDRLYAQMAEFDRLTNQTTYNQTLKQCLVLAESISPGFLTTSVRSLSCKYFRTTDIPLLNYGYAAARAYNAYQDPDFIPLAVTSWTTAKQYTISKEQAISGTINVKKSEIAPSCQGVPLTGVGQSTDPTDAYLYSLASGFFLVVSALLAEATSNQTYLDAAIESATFIQSHLLNPSNTVMDFLSSNTSQHCSLDTSAFSTNTGIFVEGLVILADITCNTSTEALLQSVIVTMTTNLSWQELDGILDGAYVFCDCISQSSLLYFNGEVNSDGGHYIVRALAALYERNMTSSNLREYIKEYIGMQYNAVIEKTTLGGSNIYGIPWTGPPRTMFSSSTTFGVHFLQNFL
ncbi:hypothetical protein EDD18DRAFT_1362252 [Armillaria luteobubalina]|uniref:Uncharacterized protein n=1 Tax=Armillaria luteobubalina TaxID=153913 RepID=A0AA39PF09_9AGAR|nr:hypothetical protein EDD18DRAFT_1362252 [Armillaria luteobubalina]